MVSLIIHRSWRMETFTIFGTRIFAGGLDPLTPNNDNLELMTGCGLTPAEFMQWVRQQKHRLSREVAVDARLWTCPKYQKDLMLFRGLEQLTLWHCYGVWRR
jgi:hypothetical protein